ncbi:MAG: signal recognition particle protein [Eubacteriales bacterium]|nr:signal recognition particle protein [Eubacteriales bacterium]
MAFESLSDKFQAIFKKLKGKGKLSEEDVNLAVREVKLALLEADVSFKVVKDFTKRLKEKAIGQEVFTSLTPAQTVIKIVKDELIEMMGAERKEIEIVSGRINTIMMTGLQGAGKTTTATKLALKMKEAGKRPLLVACDIYRPAAIKQLQVNGDRVKVPVFSMGTEIAPPDIAKSAMKHAEENGNNIVIFDTAGRLHIDEALMAELVAIREAVSMDTTVLVVDAMTGQDALNVAETFHKEVGIDGVIMSKMDGDARGGAALSIKAQTGCPVLYVATGEKPGDLEPFYPDRIASRILGMGDLMTLIEKAEQTMDAETGRALEEKLRKADFNFDDFLEQMKQIKQMGPVGDLLNMIPGMSANLKGVDLSALDEGALDGIEAIILSMTPQERANPDLLNPSRKNRIAKGSGKDMAEVNRLVKQFDQMKKMMKRFGGKKKKRFGGFGAGGFNLPF